MKTLRVEKPCDPPRLSEELVAALVASGLSEQEARHIGGWGITVRASSAARGEPAMYAVVVTGGLTSQQERALDAALKKHVEKRKPSRTPTPQEMENGLRRMEGLEAGDTPTSEGESPPIVDRPLSGDVKLVQRRGQRKSTRRSGNDSDAAKERE